MRIAFGSLHSIIYLCPNQDSLSVKAEIMSNAFRHLSIQWPVLSSKAFASLHLFCSISGISFSCSAAAIRSSSYSSFFTSLSSRWWSFLTLLSSLRTWYKLASLDFNRAAETLQAWRKTMATADNRKSDTLSDLECHLYLLQYNTVRTC